MTKRTWTLVLALLPACADDDQLDADASDGGDTAIEREAPERDVSRRLLAHRLTASERAALGVRVDDADGSRTVPLDERFGSDVVSHKRFNRPDFFVECTSQGGYSCNPHNECL